MNAKEHSVKEWHMTLDALPAVTFRVQGETLDRAVKKLKADLTAAIRELTPEKKPTRPTDGGSI